MALKDIDTELHEYAHIVHGIKDLVLAQNRDMHVLALKKLVLSESIDHDIFPENVREFARNYYRQKKDLLFINKNDVLFVRYSDHHASIVSTRNLGPNSRTPHMAWHSTQCGSLRWPVPHLSTGTR